MKKIFIILIWCLILTSGKLEASPYCDVNMSSEINGHRWGIWRLVDVPIEGLDNIFHYKEFKTYWYIGFGTFAIIQMSQGTFIVVIIGLIAFIVSILSMRIIRKKKCPEQNDRDGLGSAGAPPSPSS
jgi:hypothetical protein